jgi:hypothetical protein
VSVVTTEKAYADSLSDAPLCGTGTDRLDPPGHFMARHPGKIQTWKLAVDNERVGMTNAASFHSDENAARRRTQVLVVRQFAGCWKTQLRLLCMF